MPKQPAIPGLRDAVKKKVTRREQFLAEMEVKDEKVPANNGSFGVMYISLGTASAERFRSA